VVWFSQHDAKSITRYLNIPLRTFYQQFARKVGNRWSLKERKSNHGKDCVFLDRDERHRALCRIYPVRPTQCKTWPFWPENLDDRESWRKASKTCPGMNSGQWVPLEQIRIIRDSNPPD
jgi:Fe-S-cluster containining protein